MCLLNYNKKYKHLTYAERTMIERWHNKEHLSKKEIEDWLNNYPRAMFDYKSSNMLLLNI